MMTQTELSEQFEEKIWILRRLRDTEWNMPRQRVITDMDLIRCIQNSDMSSGDQLYPEALSVCGPEIVSACIFYGWIENAETKYTPTEVEWEVKREAWAVEMGELLW